MKWLKKLWYTYLIGLYNDRIVSAQLNHELARVEQLHGVLETLRNRRDSL